MGARFWKGLFIGLVVIASVFSLIYEILVRYMGV